MTDFDELSDAAAFDARFHSDETWWLLKHSAICPTSAAALAAVRSHLAAHPAQRVALVVVQRQRDLCRHISEATGRTHQSPQLFLLRSGTVLWHASHWAITAAAMAAAVEGA